ncbi:MAG: hypothetical protein E7438_03320 [Ruminococcaceae bacterium]|nr:hypothetical protein [Oscillospiraceae bacterium]
MNYRVKEKKNFALALLSVMGLSVDVRDVEDLELDGYNRRQLQGILTDLQTKLAALRRQEPEKGGAMYERWDDAVFCLEDQLWQVEEALEKAEDEEEPMLSFWEIPVPRPQLRMA